MEPTEPTSAHLSNDGGEPPDPQRTEELSPASGERDTENYGSPSFLPGAVLAGKYRLSEPIGEGGMGSVWVADQLQPIKRRVAVKLIKAGMDSKQVLARFEAERQALAIMDHPNIAKVFDAGLHDGRPFFVMELVKGVPITKFCDDRKLTPRERLELFIPICKAIQHAHQKGVIHRDIKPNNVIVALYDDMPSPKVIDFGVAKATGQDLTEATIETSFGAVVGTPQYMSPEQATLNNLDIDTRSDVYSLGVLLYELLVGSPPFSRDDLVRKGLLEILRAVREDEPLRPSAKLSTAEALPTLSANRGTEPKRLTGILRKELDWIVMKAIEKDRVRRYDSANGLAADVQRYLAGEPVMAHPASIVYRVYKQLRRRPAMAGVVLAIGFGAVMGIYAWIQTAISEQMREARDLAVFAQDAAETQRMIAEGARELAVEQEQLARRATYFSRTSLAGYSWQKSQLNSMSSLLDMTKLDSDLHGFEWRYLQRLRQYPSLALRDSGYVTRTAYYHNGNRIITTSTAEPPAVWNITDGSRTELNIGRNGGVFALAVSSTGLVAVEGPNYSIRLFDINNGALTGELTGSTGRISDMQFDPSGKLLVSAGWDAGTRLVRVWDVDARRQLSEFPVNIYRGVALSPDGNLLAAGDRSGKLHLYDLPTNAERSVLSLHRQNVTDAEFSPDGRFVVSVSLDGSVCRTDVETTRNDWTSYLREMVFGAAISPDGRTVVAVGESGLAHVLSAETGQKKYDLRAHTGPMETVSFHPDGDRFVSGGEDGQTVVLPLSENQGSSVLRGHTKAVTGVAISRDGKWAASVSEDETIRIWNTTTGNCAQSFKGNGLGIKAVAFSPSGDQLACGGWDSLVSIWDWRAGKRISNSIQFQGDVTSVSYSLDGSKIVCASGDHQVRILDANNLVILREFAEHSHWVYDAEFSPDGRRVASIDFNQVCFVWNAETGDVELTLPDTGGEGGSVAFHASGQWLMTTTYDQAIQEWNLADGSRGRLFPGHSGRIASLSFTHDGSRLVSASRDKSVRVWDFATGQLALEIIGHSKEIKSAIIDPSGAWIVSGDTGGVVRVWNGSPVTPGATAQAGQNSGTMGAVVEPAK